MHLWWTQIPGNAFIAEAHTNRAIMVDDLLGYIECPICGFEFKRGEMVKDWTGMLVCYKDADKRHPLDSMDGSRQSFFIIKERV